MIRKDLRDKRAALVAQNRAISDQARTETRDMTGDEMTQFEARMNDVDRLTKQIALEERQSELEAADQRPADQREGQEQEGEFRSLGHFVHEVRFNPGVLERRALSM